MASPSSIDHRLDALVARLQAESLRGCVVSDADDIRWLTGFTGSAGVVIVAADDPTTARLVTDGRYVDQAASQLRSVGVACGIVEQRSVAETRLEIARAIAHGGRWGIQMSNMSLAEYEAIVAATSGCGRDVERGDFADVGAILVDLRRTKDATEIERITVAARIADAALADTAHLVASGNTEREVRDALEASMRRHGADGVSFETIVASGENAALPHHRPSDRVLQAGDAVVIDFGALVDGYHSDMTRTFVIDGPGADAMRERHRVVRESCEAGVALVGPGTRASEVDAACRRVLAAAGLEGELTHGVGHGVGLRIHEAPWINARSQDVLRVGDVVTVEPGAYRVGLGGVRVEELLVVTETGHLVLSQSPKDPTCPPSPPTTSRTE